MEQFDYWTKDKFAANFRKMLVLEQYRDSQFGQLYHNYLAAGPAAYMAAIFRRLTDSDSSAMQLALEFYGPMFLLYSLYDAADDKENVDRMLRTHIDRFLEKDRVRLRQVNDDIKRQVPELCFVPLKGCCRLMCVDN